MSKDPFRRAKKTVEVSVGESVRIVRELQGLSQNQLAQLTGIPQSTISGIENDRVNLGVDGRVRSSRRDRTDILVGDVVWVGRTLRRGKPQIA